MTLSMNLRHHVVGLVLLGAGSLVSAGCTGGSGTTETATTAESESATGTSTDATETASTSDDPVACGDALPPEGSACADDGATCAPDADPCDGYTFATCDGGVWVYGDAGPGDPELCTPIPCGDDDVPPEDSPCAVEGESCAPNKDLCLPYTDAICTEGLWKYTFIGPGDPSECDFPCDPDNLPPEGSACTMEGEFCSPGCEDPCEFCNVLTCEGGAWQPLEVFPAECLSCDEICPTVVDAGCAAGPPDLEACVDGCVNILNSPCMLDYNKMLACVGAEPTFTCAGDDLPIVDGCEEQFDALYACTMP